MLKKLSLIIIITVLAYSQVGYYFVLRHSQTVQKDVIKEKIVNQLKEEELEVISPADNKEISWEENGKEFLFKGEMYDVVKTISVNGKVILYCLNDKKEKSLIDNYNLITKHNSSPDKKGKSTFNNSFNLFVYQDEKNGEQYAILELNKFYSIASHLTQGVDDTVFPPPKA